MHRPTATAAFWILLVVTATPALAQEPRFAVAVKGGLSAENSEDKRGVGHLHLWGAP